MRLSVPLLTSLLAFAVAPPMQAADYCGPQQPAYGAGYPPAAYSPPAAYRAGYAPTAGTTFVAGPTYTAGFTPTAPTAVDPAAIAPLASNGSYQAQRPAYYENPSVYSGGAVYGGTPAVAYQSGYQSFRTPLTNSLRGNAMPMSATSAAPSIYASAYDGSIPGQPLPVAVPTGAPPTTIAATTTVTPIYPAPAPPPKSSGCCLSRFCARLFGTNYSTSYYRAPVTYYRPVTTTSPTTGAPVVVQRPCTSYVQQVQRTPYTSLQFGHSATAPPASSCPTPATCGPSSCGQIPCAPTQYAPSTFGSGATTVGPTIGNVAPGTVGQVGAIGIPNQATGIPSTAPSAAPQIQPYLAPAQPGYGLNASPLTGAPTMAPPSTGAGNDMAPVGQPRLENGSVPPIPANKAPSPPVQTAAPSSQSAASVWQLQNPGDSTALIRPRASATTIAPPSIPTQQAAPPTNSTAPTNLDSPVAPPTTPQSVFESDNFTNTEPIQAPTDYVAPYGRQTSLLPKTTPVTQRLPRYPSPRNYGATSLTSISSRASADSFKQASPAPPSRSFITQPSASRRDSTWTSVPNHAR